MKIIKETKLTETCQNCNSNNAINVFTFDTGEFIVRLKLCWICSDIARRGVLKPDKFMENYCDTNPYGKRPAISKYSGVL